MSGRFPHAATVVIARHELLTLPGRETMGLRESTVRRVESRSCFIWGRRHSMQQRLLTVVLGAGLLAAAFGAQAQNKLKVGFMLPYTGTYAALGTAIENGFRLLVQEQGGKLAGRELEYYKVDDESDPSKATDNVNRLIKRDQVDVLVGSVHSGVAMAMAKVARESETLLIVPN